MSGVSRLPRLAQCRSTIFTIRNGANGERCAAEAERSGGWRYGGGSAAGGSVAGGSAGGSAGGDELRHSGGAWLRAAGGAEGMGAHLGPVRVELTTAHEGLTAGTAA